jgi:hypothetical protein
MSFRDREEDAVRSMRAKYANEFALAEEVLELGARILSNRQIRAPEGDVLLGRIIIGHLIKIVHAHWGIIVLAERALPSSSLIRELAEAVISLAYLVAEESAQRARLYRDHIAIRDLKDINRRLNDPELRQDVTGEEQGPAEEHVQVIITQRGQQEYERMKEWKTWGGPFSLETMAQRAGVPSAVYKLLYVFESRAPHSLDLFQHMIVASDGTLIASLPATAERHLLSSATLTLAALGVGDNVLALGHYSEIAVLNARVESAESARNPDV